MKIYGYIRDLAPMVNEPETYADQINEILKKASKVQNYLERIYRVLNNPSNSEISSIIPVTYSINLDCIPVNILWAAACLMQNIPDLKTESNLALSIEYLDVGVAYNYVPALSNLGWCYKEGLGVPIDYNQAIELFKNVIELDTHKKFPSTWNSLGWCYKQLGIYQEAEECYKKMLEINPNNAVAKEQLKIISLLAQAIDKDILSYDSSSDEEEKKEIESSDSVEEKLSQSSEDTVETELDDTTEDELNHLSEDEKKEDVTDTVTQKSRPKRNRHAFFNDEKSAANEPPPQHDESINKRARRFSGNSSD